MSWLLFDINSKDNGDGSWWKILNNKVRYRPVVSQNEQTFKVVDILRAASPFLSVQINILRVFI